MAKNKAGASAKALDLDFEPLIKRALKVTGCRFMTQSSGERDMRFVFIGFDVLRGLVERAERASGNDRSVSIDVASGASPARRAKAGAVRA